MKKLLVVFAIIGSILGGVTLVDYFLDEIDLYSSIMDIFYTSEEVSNNIMDKNNKSFIPAVIRGNLKKEEYYGDIGIVPIVYKTDIVGVPVMGDNYSTTYADTVYSDSGEYYIVLSKDKTDKSNVDEVTMLEYKLGRGEPVVLEVRFPNTNSVLYIQCYTPEAYGFYSEYDWDSIFYTQDKNLGLTDDELAAKTSIPQEIIPNKSNMSLDEDYVTIVNNYRLVDEGYVRFLNYNDYKVGYYRSVGYLDTNMRCEYAKLTSMGYKPLEYGNYKDIAYIKFEDFTVLGSNVTNNSCLIFYVS